MRGNEIGQIQASSFPLRNICGTWVSGWGSPDLRIYYDGRRFRLVYEYAPDAAFTFLLRKDSRGNTYFDFYGKILLTYSGDEELLTLSIEGNYTRAENQSENQ